LKRFTDLGARTECELVVLLLRRDILVRVYSAVTATAREFEENNALLMKIKRLISPLFASWTSLSFWRPSETAYCDEILIQGVRSRSGRYVTQAVRRWCLAAEPRPQLRMIHVTFSVDEMSLQQVFSPSSPDSVLSLLCIVTSPYT
jgi:hypothetical protein